MKANSFTLNFEMRKNYLYAYVNGQLNYATSIDYWNQIAEKIKVLNATRVLVHEDMMGRITEGEVFEIIMDLLPYSTAIQVAFYDENRGDYSVTELAELIASNRGINFRAFQTLEDAETWISEA